MCCNWFFPLVIVSFSFGWALWLSHTMNESIQSIVVTGTYYFITQLWRFSMIPLSQYLSALYHRTKFANARPPAIPNRGTVFHNRGMVVLIQGMDIGQLFCFQERLHQIEELLYKIEERLFHIKARLFHIEARLFHSKARLFHIEARLFHIETRLFKIYLGRVIS